MSKFATLSARPPGDAACCLNPKAGQNTRVDAGCGVQDQIPFRSCERATVANSEKLCCQRQSTLSGPGLAKGPEDPTWLGRHTPLPRTNKSCIDMQTPCDQP